MSERRAPDVRSGAGAVGMAFVVLALVLFVRPGGSDEDPAPAASPSASPSGPGPTGAPPSAAEFCQEFRELAAAQTVYAATPDTRGADLLRESADALVALGPPESMPVEARGGLYTVVSGIYGSIGETLPPSAVPGAADGPQITGSDQAFGAWLADVCPA